MPRSGRGGEIEDKWSHLLSRAAITYLNDAFTSRRSWGEHGKKSGLQALSLERLAQWEDSTKDPLPPFYCESLIRQSMIVGNLDRARRFAARHPYSQEMEEKYGLGSDDAP